MRSMMVAAFVAAVAAAALGDVTGTITTEGGSVHKGALRWSSRDKAYAVTSKDGIEIQVKPGDVAELVVDPPANYEAAVAQVHAGQGAAAIPALQKIVKQYAHLQWDKTAGRSLAEAYISTGKAEDGLRICEGIIRDDATAAYKGDLAPAYWAALLALDKRSRLEGSLAKAAKSGDRFSAGAALIKRGDIALKDGKDSAEANRKALTDGYLRVVLLYRDEEFAAKLQPEALYKAAQCFEKLNMSGRADSMRGTLKQLYASSPWAAK